MSGTRFFFRIPVNVFPVSLTFESFPLGTEAENCAKGTVNTVVIYGATFTQDSVTIYEDNQPFANWMYDADNYRLSVNDIKHDFCNSTVEFILKWTK
jgi:hypothetical protein